MAQRRTVVCFGDSNTYGVVPSQARFGGHRFAPERRWPGVLKKALGPNWDVIEEGLPGRTTVHPDPVDGAHKNGLEYLPIVLETHMPIDLVIVMLGTNDLKMRFSMPATDIAESIYNLVEHIKKAPAGHAGNAPNVLVVAPPPVKEIGRLAEMFSGGAAKSQRFGTLFADAAKRGDVAFLDAGALIEASDADGIHLDSDGHARLGQAIARTIENEFPSLRI